MTAHKPSRVFLLSLDLVIVLLEFILTTIAYETSFTLAIPSDTPDPLQPESIPHTPVSPSTLDTNVSKPTETLYHDAPEYIIDLRLGPLLSRLRHPPPPPPPQQPNISQELLPLPNTTAFHLTRSLNMLVRARAQMRERTARATENGRTNRAAGDTVGRRERQPGEEQESRIVPGSMGGEDDP